MADELPINFQFPSELSYPMPSQIPAGIKQVQLRQINYNTIPQPTPQGTEIQIVIPQLDACFLDPSTTYINVKFQVTYTAQAGKFPFSDHGGILGSGWTLFDRYQVYANNSTLVDDINEVGVLANALYRLNMDSSLRQGSGGPLGFQHTTAYDFCHYTTTQAGTTAGIDSEANIAVVESTTISGVADGGFIKPHSNSNAIGLRYWSQLASEGPDSITGYGVADRTVQDFNNKFGAYDTTPAISANTVCTQTMNVCLPLFGILGSGSDRMFPMFIGPTRINLIVANLLGASGAGSLCKTTTLGTAGVTAMSILNCEFIGTYLRLDPASVAMVMGSLPSPMQFVMRCTSYVNSSLPLSANTAAGTYEGLVSSRRASTKFILGLFSPSLGAFGKYASVNPNLSIGSCLVINGQQFPQQTIDPYNYPHEYMNQVHMALNTANNLNSKPSIMPTNYMVAATTDYSPNYRSFYTVAEAQQHPNMCTSPNLNDFWPFLIDVEHFSRRGFLSGTSTNNGSCFVRLNFAKALGTSSWTVNLFNYHDMIVVCDYNLKQTSVKA